MDARRSRRRSSTAGTFAGSVSPRALAPHRHGTQRRDWPALPGSVLKDVAPASQFLLLPTPRTTRRPFSLRRAMPPFLSASQSRVSRPRMLNWRRLQLSQGQRPEPTNHSRTDTARFYFFLYLNVTGRAASLLKEVTTTSWAASMRMD